VASEVTDGTVDVRRDRDIAIITLRTGEVTTSRAVVVTGGDIVFSAGCRCDRTA